MQQGAMSTSGCSQSQDAAAAILSLIRPFGNAWTAGQRSTLTDLIMSDNPAISSRLQPVKAVSGMDSPQVESYHQVHSMLLRCHPYLDARMRDGLLSALFQCTETKYPLELASLTTRLPRVRFQGEGQPKERRRSYTRAVKEDPYSSPASTPRSTGKAASRKGTPSSAPPAKRTARARVSRKSVTARSESESSSNSESESSGMQLDRSVSPSPSPSPSASSSEEGSEPEVTETPMTDSIKGKSVSSSSFVSIFELDALDRPTLIEHMKSCYVLWQGIESLCNITGLSEACLKLTGVRPPVIPKPQKYLRQFSEPEVEVTVPGSPGIHTFEIPDTTRIFLRGLILHHYESKGVGLFQPEYKSQKVPDLVVQTRGKVLAQLLPGGGGKNATDRRFILSTWKELQTIGSWVYEHPLCVLIPTMARPISRMPHFVQTYTRASAKNRVPGDFTNWGFLADPSLVEELEGDCNIMRIDDE
ncbi:hypothetical protein KIPB_001397 [Kipferlia bialata]|uniref:Uncharacterized protein n=1 Tax=Kipferlia bialata TaxID=797122 RepID=A0A9K3CQJ7_9EUKA|nr:hypothetical protein KIPB_001397 [Kipferlia bialata]|eukprot:g1397.t1